MLLYKLGRPLVNIFLRVFYKFEYKGMENIPSKKPIIWAPNHVNAFIDPIVIAMTVSRKVRFFARGDVFKGRVMKWALNSFNISPMFRIQEGYGELKKNDKTFEECRQLLSNNKTVLIFPEAICVQERRLRPLKKGLSRILFQTEERFDFKKDVVVIPVGLNYSNPSKFRSTLYMEFGKPISIKKYEEQFKQDKVKTINTFTRSLEKEMAKHLVIINNPENDKLVEALEEIYMDEWLKENNHNKTSLEKQFHASKSIAEMINYLDEHKPKAIESLKEKTKKYIKDLNKNKLRDHLLREESINKMNIGNFILDFFMLWFGMFVYALGLLMNYPPYYFAKRFCTEKIKNVEFFASVYANLAMVLWLLYYAIQLLTVALVFRNWMLLGIYALTVPMTGGHILGFYPMMKKILGKWKLLRLVRTEKHTVEKLVNERAAIIHEIELAKNAFLSKN